MDTRSLLLVANAGDGSISTFGVAQGGLTRLAVTPGLTGCSTFAVDAERDLVYAGVKAGGAHATASIATLRLHRDSGELELLSRRPLPEGAVTYLALAAGGTTLLGASYSGYGISCAVSDGVVGDPVATVRFPRLHSVLPSADGRFAYFVSLGADLVAQYALSADHGLVPLEPATVAAPAGSGPRHLVLTEDQTAVYVLTEFSGEVLHYARDTDLGTLQLRGGVDVVDPSAGLGRSRLDADPRDEHLVWGADLHLADGDRRVWASERTESTLGSAAIAADGSLTASEHVVAAEAQPRGFAVSPDGALLVCTGERSDSVSLFAVDGERLDLRQRIPTGRGANWARFV